MDPVPFQKEFYAFDEAVDVFLLFLLDPSPVNADLGPGTIEILVCVKL